MGPRPAKTAEMRLSTLGWGCHRQACFNGVRLQSDDVYLFYLFITCGLRQGLYTAEVELSQFSAFG